jgi:DNA polymerase-3 subunit delta
MVAIKTRDAERFIAAPPEAVRLFLVYGDDPGAITEAARRLERHALHRGGSDAVIRFGSDEISADPGRIADEVYAAPLFGGEPVVGLRVLDGRHNVIGALQAVFERPPDAAWLIVEAGELTPASPLRKAFEGEPRAAALPIFHADAAALASLVRATAEGAGVTIEPEAQGLLLSALGGDRMASRGELEKLFLYVGAPGPVTPADVRAVVGDTSAMDADQVIDAAIGGDSEAFEAGLERLKAGGGSPAGLGAQALRHLLQLTAMRAGMDAGQSLSAAIERARPPVFGSRRTVVEEALRRWSGEDLRHARGRLAEAIFLTRRVPALEAPAISQALHEIALTARRRRAGRNGPAEVG